MERFYNTGDYGWDLLVVTNPNAYNLMFTKEDILGNINLEMVEFSDWKEGCEKLSQLIEAKMGEL
tara:strand:- start:482 stop:676 length:195 start_codon:yes stop_codon:yes gene_type:complete